MNYAGKFGSGGLESLSHAQVDLDSVLSRGSADHVTIPDAHLLFSGDYHKSGHDLIISDHEHRVVVPNYFQGEKRPTLVSPEGAPLDAKVVEALTGHVQYAQAGDPPAAKVVGHVAEMTGSASIVRNGVAIVVQAGDAVYQSDVVQTGSGSTLGLVLSDGTTFNLSANARLMLNDLTFDATSTSNSALFTLVQGAASFVAGQVAKTGDMKVATPVATMGIRGTAVTLEISSTDGSVEISVIDQRDGLVHAVEAFDSKGNLIGLITSNGGTLTLTPTASFEVIAKQSKKTPAQIAEEFAKYQAALATYDIQKAIDPNLPQHSDAGNNPNPQQTKTANGSGFLPPPPPPNGGTVGGDTKNPLSGPPGPNQNNQPNDTGPGGTQTAVGAPPIDIPVIPVNHAPVVTGAVTGTVTEDGSPSVLNPLANASDVDGNVLQLTIPFELPAGVSYNPTVQTFTLNSSDPAYQHLAAGQTTTVTVNYQISDGAITVPGSVSWTVTGVNDAPVATPVTLEAGTEGTNYIIHESDLRAGVTDVDDGAELSITSVSIANGGGTLVNNGNGTWTYTPAQNYSGEVSFSYTASDGSLTSSSTATLTLEETPGTTLTFDDLPPSSSSPIPNGYGGLNWSNFFYLSGSTHAGSGYDNGTVSGSNVAFNAFGNPASVSGDVFDFDGANFTGAWNNGLTIDVKGYDINGDVKYQKTVVVTSTEPTWVEFNFDDVSSVVFTSSGGTNAGHGGIGTHFAMDNFTFSMSSAPVATAVTLEAGTEDTLYTIDVSDLLAGVSDADSQQLSITSLEIESGGGHLEENDDGTWSYTPDENYNGEVIFNYTASDGSQTSNSTASLTLAAVNDAATIEGKSTGNVAEDALPTNASGTIIRNDVDSGTLTVHDVDDGENHFRAVDTEDLNGTYGTFTFNENNGDWTYTLDEDKAQALSANQEVLETLTVTSADGTATKVIEVTVTGTNEAPQFMGDALAPIYEANGDSVALVGEVSVSDVDSTNFAGGSLTATVTDGGRQGDTLTIASGEFISLDTRGSGTIVMFDSDGEGGAEAVAIGTLSDGINSLTIELNENATDEAVEALAEAIEFENTKPDPEAGTRTVTFTLRDGDGTSHGASDSDFFNATVVIEPSVVDLDVLTSEGYDTTTLSNDLREGTLRYIGETFISVEIGEGRKVLIDAENLTYEQTGEGEYVLTGGFITGFHVSDDSGAPLLDVVGYNIPAETFDAAVQNFALDEIFANYAYNSSGGTGPDVLKGGDFADLIETGGGGDIVRAGNGDDIVTIRSNAPWDIDGGGGIDTIRLSGEFNLVESSSGQNASSIEIFDLNTTHANVIAIEPAGVFEANGDHVLRILGNANDTIILANEYAGHPNGHWVATSTQVSYEDDSVTDGVSFDTYAFTDGGETLATLYVQHGVTVDGAPVIVSDNLVTFEGINGAAIVSQLSVSNVDDDPLTITLLAGGGSIAPAGSTAGITPIDGNGLDGSLSGVGSLDAINQTLADGILYVPNAPNAPVTDKVTLTISDGHHSDSLNFIFGVTGEGGFTLNGTSGKDIFYGSNGSDQFVFGFRSGNDTITDFNPGEDKIDLLVDLPFASGDETSFQNWAASHVVQSDRDTHITFDDGDSILLKNVAAISLHANDFILHPGGSNPYA